ATTNYGNTTPPTNIPSGSSAVAVAQMISGLPRGQTNHFRVIVNSSPGMVAGGDRSFAWSATPPRFTSFLFTNGSFVLRLTGQPRQSYLIEASANLADWVNLGMATDLGDGLFTLSDPTVAASRFYRARAP